MHKLSNMTTGKYVLSRSDFQSSTSNTFQELLSDSNFTDVTLVSGEENEISAHKVVLASCSSFFKRILLRYSHQKPLIYLNGIKFSDLQAIIKFMYLGEAEIKQADIESFLDAAKVLEVRGITTDTGGTEEHASLLEDNGEARSLDPVMDPK